MTRPERREIGVRAARSSDVPALTDILNDIIRAGGTTAYEQPMTPGEFKTHFLVGEQLIAAHVAELSKSDDLFGFQTIVRNADLPDMWADIATFARQSPKLKGVGTALFAATRRTAHRLGLTAINATIRADNSSGLGYYDRMGFVTYRTIAAVPLRDGTPVDRIRKRFDLEPSA